MASVERVVGVEVIWGESARWDDQTCRLYFVDCATSTLHWLENGGGRARTTWLPSMPTGVVLTEGAELLACLDDGIHLVHPDAGTTELYAQYPEQMHGRANDANADGYGNLITGTLNLSRGPGSYWWFSAENGWRLLDDTVSNANGPAVTDVDGTPTLVIADTAAGVVYAYDYDPAGTVSRRRVLAGPDELGGAPDGATVDADGGVWSCVLGPGRLVRLTDTGVDSSIDVPTPNPSDVTFAGPGSEVMYVTSIATSVRGGGEPADCGWLFRINDPGCRGRPEPRFSLRHAT